MSKMILKVEFLAGTSLEDAIKEARDKAYLNRIAYVAFNFNGTDFSIGSHADIKEALRQYHMKEKFIVCA